MKLSRGRVHRWVSCIALVMFGLFAACSESGDQGAAPGTASVSLTDIPDCGYEVVNVTVSKVRIHQSNSANDNDAGWSEITLNPPRTINLLDLNDPTQPNFALDATAIGLGREQGESTDRELDCPRGTKSKQPEQ